MSAEFLPIKPVCKGLGRKETTSLLNSELIRCKLDRRNAYSYWAHEVEMHDYAKEKSVWVDFVHFEPDWYHAATHAGCVECGTFTFYEVKSCLADMKSGSGLNFLGDRNYVVTTIEAYDSFCKAWAKGDKKLVEAFGGSYYGIGFLLYGELKNGRRGFYEIEPATFGSCRLKPAAEILLCMLRALIANSERADVQHSVEQISTKSECMRELGIEVDE